MSANLPILWADKEDSPELKAYLEQFSNKYYFTATEINQLRDAVNEMAVIQQSTSLGIAEPTDTPTGTGRNYWEVITPGTYTNFGGVVLEANKRGLIYRNELGIYSISKVGFDLSTYAKLVDLINKADLEPAKNKFNKNTITAGYLLSNTNGLSANAAYNLSDYIKVIPLSSYISNKTMRYVTYFNASKVYVSGGASANSTAITVPVGVEYIRLSLDSSIASVATFQLELGTVKTTYEDWKLVVKPIQLDLGYINEDLLLLNKKKANLKVGKNKFDYINNIITPDKFLSSTGSISSASTTYGITDYIEIEANKAYFSSAISYDGGSYYCFYDINKNYISSSNVIGTLSPSNAFYARFSVIDSTIPSTIQIEEGTTATAYESFKMYVSSVELNLAEYVKNTEVDALLAAKAPLLVAGKNIFNKNSGLVQTGKYISYLNGIYSNNAIYAVTGKIEIPTGTTQITLSYKHQIAFFNSAGVYISGSNSTDTNKTQAVPAGAKYVDCTLLSGGVDSFMLVLGAEIPSSYIGYKKIVPSDNLEIYSSKIINDGDPLSADTFKSFLPKEICVAVGRTIELYNNQVSWCGNINDYNFLWSGIGKSMKRKWSLTGVTIGINTLTLKVYNKNNVLIATKTTTVKVVSATINIPFTIAAIGDSLSNQKPWNAEVRSLSGNTISFVGTRNSGTSEGRSGATSSYYLGNNSYTFDSLGVSGIDGRAQDLNPFWSPVTSDVNYQYYLDNYSTPNPDKLIIWLGTNGIAVDPTTNATNIKTLIDKIRLTGGSAIPIFVVHTLFRGNQDGIGKQTGSDGYVANSSYKLEEDLKVFNLQEKILADLSAYSNLYLIPISTCHDSEFNFGAVSTPVNPRAAQVEYLPSEATHPQNQGYLQIADIIFSSLAANQ